MRLFSGACGKDENLSTYDWKVGKEYREIRYELCDGVAKISINRQIGRASCRERV